MTQTDDLIEALARQAIPVRPLPPPAWRATAWLGLTAAAIGGVVAIDGPCPNLTERLADPLYQLILGSAALTGISAGGAAFFHGLPDRSRLWTLAPLPPLLIWAGAIAGGCLCPWPPLDKVAIALGDTLHCTAVFMAVGIAVSALLLGMLRRTPLSREPAARWLAGLAVAGLTTFGFSLTHTFAEPPMILVWNGAAGVAAAMAVGTIWRRGPRGYRAAV